MLTITGGSLLAPDRYLTVTHWARHGVDVSGEYGYYGDMTNTLRHVATYGLLTYVIDGDTLTIHGHASGVVQQATLAPMTQERAETVGREMHSDNWREIDEWLTISLTAPECIIDGMGYALEWAVRVH